MKSLKYVLCLALAVLATASMAKAQTVTNEFTGLGSSALFLELGKAAVARAAAVTPTETVCSWTTKDGGASISNDIYAFDQAPEIQNNGNFFVIYTSTDSTCATLGTGAVNIWTYLQEDSAVGNRCVYRTGSTAEECILVVPANTAGNVTASAGANLISGQTDIAFALPSGIITALNGQQFQVAGTDVRPEDSQFQIYRALQSTSTLITSTRTGGAGYYGLGLAASSTNCPSPSGSPVSIAVTGGSLDGGAAAVPGSVTVAQFALPGGTDPCTGAAAVNVATIIPVGATPVVVAVNNTNTKSGFGQAAITNISRGDLAAFLDGDLCRPQDLVNNVKATRTGTDYSTTLIREPFSGTYTTMEYSVAASRGVEGSQESGIATPTTQPSVWTSCDSSSKGVRTRVTSTGNMVYAIQNNTDALGYFFWSTANGAKFTSTSGVPTNAKYLTVDGVDPLLSTYVNGCIPIAAETTAGCELSNVTFQNIKSGAYPIWSIQRLVVTCSTGSGCTPTQATEAQKMATQAQNEVSSTLPDFVPANSLYVFHQHFLPPTPTTIQGSITVANGNNSFVEAGGDVGGIVHNTQSDIDYTTDFVVHNGLTNIRNSGGITPATGSALNNGNPGTRQ